MSLQYVPVMAAKRGEFTALRNLQLATVSSIIPFFELPSKKPTAVLIEKTIARTALNAGKAWAERSAFLDFSKWSTDARTETGIHVLEYAFAQFRANNVIAHPVIGYDRWDDPVYSQALRNIIQAFRSDVTPCIRLDRESIEDLHDLSYFASRIQDIFDTLNIGANNCYVMVDFGDVSKTPVPEIIEETEVAIQALRSIGFGIVIVAGGSMPAGVNQAVDTPDTEGCIPRIEMMAWKAVLSSLKDPGIIFSDYLVRNAKSAEGVIAPDANAKIRYTIENQSYIVRGHSKRKDSLTVQHKDLSQKLIGSTHYIDAAFSWGDSQLMNCALGLTELREATAMIAVDSNHHIHAIVAEIFEHHRVFIPYTDTRNQGA